MSEPTPYELTGPLPAGTTVLEASAGTGKTYTIAALAARYVVEGKARLDQLLLVTFGRMASNELRERVRERLVSTERQLSALIDGREDEVGSLHDVEQMLIGERDPADLRVRHARVLQAMSDFDRATIATTHEFSQEMLDGLGVLGDREPLATFVDQITDLVDEVVGDVYLQRYAIPGNAPVNFETALQLGRAGLSQPHAVLAPEESDRSDPRSAERVAFVREVQREVERRKRARRLFTYDDMLTRLRDALIDPDRGEQAAQRLRDRYQVVMVDEFQDTDPIQWEILSRAFHGSTTMILIGDPKQAIYAFRGADVFSYLDAVAKAKTFTLAMNWRTDAALVRAFDQLMGGAALGDPRIVVRPVDAHYQARRLVASADQPDQALFDHRVDQCAPFRLRTLPYDPDSQLPLVAKLRGDVEKDLVADITRLLAAPPLLTVGETQRTVKAGDIAILVRTNRRGDTLRDALVAAGVPAVMLGATSVFAAPAATEWLTLLRALEQPRGGTTRRAALTCFFGRSLHDLVTDGEAGLDTLARTVRWWSRVLAGQGVAALLEAIIVDTDLTKRVLGQVDGDRLLTDLRHVAQALHAAKVKGQLGTSALVQWLADRINESTTQSNTDGSRRLETDAAAVQILTVHRSKGLEFPIVYLPDAWDNFVNAEDKGQTLSLHDEVGRSLLDVGGISGPNRGRRWADQAAESAGEDLRLLYVALTRAGCQVVTWWAASRNTPPSALQRFLWRSSTDASVPDQAYPLTADPSTSPRTGGLISLEPVSRRELVPVPGGEPTEQRLQARQFERELDLDWRRTSYSALTAAVHGLDLVGAGVSSEAEVRREDDEAGGSVAKDLAVDLTGDRAGGMATSPDQAQPYDADLAAQLATVSPMADLPSGAQFGTAVHAIFEEVDPQARDLSAEVRRATAVALAHVPTGALDLNQLSDALLPCFATPLGPLADGLRLIDLPVSDRLPELGFEMPLAGGDRARGTVLLGAVAELLRRHLPVDDPLVDYPAWLEHPALAEQPLRGYLTGSIDAVLRVRDEDGTPRYLVVDYKTNWLGDFDRSTLTLGDYTPLAMAEAMMHAHYPLQALLYGVAVHRLLRWRQPGYDPAVHLGGVLYLFVRGMAGADTPVIDGVPCGVFSWRPPAALITELSDVLHGLAEPAHAGQPSPGPGGKPSTAEARP